MRRFAHAAKQSGAAPKPGADKIEHRNRKAAVDIHRLRQIGDIPDIETAKQDGARKRLEDADDPSKQRRFAGAVRADHRDKGAGGDRPVEVVHRRMPVIAQRDVPELHLRGHAHLIASHTTAQRPALTASAAPSREATVMRRIDKGAACGGCGDAGPWACARGCPCPWLWRLESDIKLCYIIT